MRRKTSIPTSRARARARHGRSLVAVLAAGLALLAVIGTAAFLALRPSASASGAEWMGAPRAKPAQRLLVVGWDGATFRTIDPLLAAGRLPNVARMLERGASARLESTRVPISSAAWTGATTGKTPGENGVYAFFEPVPGTYDVKLISSLSNRSTPLWRILARHGMRSIVFGIPGTYPPEPLPGVMVGCMLSPLESDYAWPPGLADRLRARGFVPDLGQWRAEQELTWEKIEEQERLKREILLEMLAREDWDMTWVVFKSLDVLSHYAYDGAIDGDVARLYELLDDTLGALLEAVGPETNVLLVSDHGFQTYRRMFFAQTWLIEQGYAVYRPNLPPSQPPSGPLGERRSKEHRMRIDDLDLARTRVLVDTCEGNFGGLRLNLAGREPEGSVSASDAPALLAEIEAKLRASKIPGTESPLVTNVWRGAELYPGPFAANLPDLVFETDAGVLASTLSSRVTTLAIDPRIKPQSDHDLYGIFLAAGPAIAHRAERGEASIFDVAPTALHLLGLPLYSEMTGRARVELLANPGEPKRVAELEDARAHPTRARPRPEGFTDEEYEQVRKGLQNLGYVEGNEDK